MLCPTSSERPDQSLGCLDNGAFLVWDVGQIGFSSDDLRELVDGHRGCALGLVHDDGNTLALRLLNLGVLGNVREDRHRPERAPHELFDLAEREVRRLARAVDDESSSPRAEHIRQADCLVAVNEACVSRVTNLQSPERVMLLD